MTADWRTEKDDPLKSLFSNPLEYSYTAFRHATLLYEDFISTQDLHDYCDDLSRQVNMHPEFLCLLRRVVEEKHVSAVVITCGLRRV